MALIKLKLVAYRGYGYKNKAEAGEYQVMINPESLTWQRRIKYNGTKQPNNSKGSPKYEGTDKEEISFDLLVDGTGVVDADNIDVVDNIKRLKAVVYDYNGVIHRPNFVKINWGEGLTFKGVLTSFDTTYTLFKNDGTPLRAKLALKFEAYTDPVTAAKLENKQSPDMTHLVDVIAGDTLPQLSQRIYESTDYYVQLAQFNGLDKFRQLQPGQQLTLPPIVNGSH
jgi:hypothetical protein